MQKIDFKKDFKELYKAPANGFTYVEVPSMLCLMIDGAGDPQNNPEFQSAIETLYSVAYTIKFSGKKAGSGPEYSIPPLSGLWWCNGMEGFDPENRDMWLWTLMLAQPPQIDMQMLTSAIGQLKEKGKKGLWSEIRLESFSEGLCVQTLHIGPYSDEGPRIAAMHKFIHDQGYALRGKHHEIYMSDPRRTSPEKLKTILRHPVTKL